MTEKPWWDEWGHDFQCEVCGRIVRKYPRQNRADSTGGYDCRDCGGLMIEPGRLLQAREQSARMRP